MMRATAHTAPDLQQADPREDWTPADYREEGRQIFDRNRADGSERLKPHLREHFAEYFAEIARPLTDRRARSSKATGPNHEQH